MYYNDKRHKVSVRLTDKQWEFILELCEGISKSPSDMIRYCIDVASWTLSAKEKRFGGGSDGSDCEADIDD